MAKKRKKAKKATKKKAKKATKKKTKKKKATKRRKRQFFNFRKTFQKKTLFLFGRAFFLCALIS